MATLLHDLPSTRYEGREALKHPAGRACDGREAPATDGGPLAALRLRRILVPLDFSSFADSAAAAAAFLARRLEAELVVLHVIPDDELEAMARSRLVRRGLDEVLADLGESLGAHARKVVGDNEAEAPRLRAIVASGPPPEGIVRSARRLQADLIVMATHGRGGLAHVVMGSVAEAVIRRAPCPVLTIRPAPR